MSSASISSVCWQRECWPCAGPRWQWYSSGGADGSRSKWLCRLRFRFVLVFRLCSVRMRVLFFLPRGAELITDDIEQPRCTDAQTNQAQCCIALLLVHGKDGIDGADLIGTMSIG